MKDPDCVRLLQWVLPRLRLHWPGFRRVRGQVCKRISRRMTELALPGPDAYRTYLDDQPAEWLRLDAMCRVSISRFYRDKAVFAMLEDEILPELAEQARSRDEHELAVWSAGCGSGEEPYSISLLWQLQLAHGLPGLQLRVLATDSDANMIRRARQGCYGYGSVKNLPAAWREIGFVHDDQTYCLLRRFREAVRLLVHDVRSTPPNGPFDLILCRNLVYTYFDPALQREITDRLRDALRPGGALVVGVHESLPQPAADFFARSERLGIFTRRPPAQDRNTSH